MPHFALYTRPHSSASGRTLLCEVAVEVTSTAYTRDKKNILTALCDKEEDLDRWIDGLIQELESVRQQGKRRLKQG